MTGKIRLLAALVFVATIIGSGTAKTVYVDANSPNYPGTGTAIDPFRRIQDAIDDPATASGDIIEIQPGTYTGTGNYDIDPKGMAITIRSIDPNDPEVVASTIIDPNETGTQIRAAFYIHSGEGPDTIIEGLTATRCYGLYGGAIYCESASPTIRKCVITNNRAQYYGAGIYGNLNGAPSSPTIINCTISDNTAANGAGLRNCHGQIRNCLIKGNSATDATGGEGGGLSNCNGTIRNCTIIDNLAVGNGGGVYNCDAEISNTIFVNNTSHAIYENTAPTDLSIINCLFYNNTDGDWYDYGTTSTLTGAAAINAQANADNNLDDDPLLDIDGLHLLEFSVCINAGNPNALYDTDQDIDAQPRSIGTTVDIGCDEFHFQCDLDYNGSVFLPDLSIFIQSWLEPGNDNEANFDGNNSINLPDFNILSQSWQKGLSP